MRCSCCNRTITSFIENGMGLDMCPFCGAYTRHRLICLALNNLNISHVSRILHFAPETSVVNKINSMNTKLYLGADKFSNEGRSAEIDILKISAEDIPFQANTFDGIIASHIMEHVDDDITCIKSFHRVMKPRGWIILMIPIFEHLLHTIGSNTTDFGQRDHKRLYSPRQLFRKMQDLDFSCSPILQSISSELREYNIHSHHKKYKYADIICRKKVLHT